MATVRILFWDADQPCSWEISHICLPRLTISFRPCSNPPQHRALPDSPSFAGLLAALACTGDKDSSAVGTTPTLLADDLADDIATLSYEHALRTHARHHSPGRDYESPGAARPGALISETLQDAEPATQPVARPHRRRFRTGSPAVSATASRRSASMQPGAPHFAVGAGSEMRQYYDPPE